jgi:hypothetical protein
MRTKPPILRDDEGQIKITYITNRIGHFNKSITVISNAQNGNHILKIKGTVLKNTI